MRRGLIILLTVALLPVVSFAKPVQRPNIVLILADDMGFSDLGCYGSEIATPNLDRMAANGVRFTQFYNCARCCPTRASLLTGLYPHQAGIGHMAEHNGLPIQYSPYPAYRGDLSRQAVTIAEVLRGVGYRTAMSGKWHVTPMSEAKHNWPLQRGFESFFGIIQSASSYFDPTGLLVRDNEVITPPRTNFYLTDAIAEQAVRDIGEFAGATERKPFFLYVAFNAPHWPLHALPEDIAKYKGKYGNNGTALREVRHAKQIQMGVVEARWPLSPRDMPKSTWNESKFDDWQDTRMAVYAAQVDRLDQNIGKILAALRDAGAEENTLVMFMSDNGACAEHIGPQFAGPFLPAHAPDGGPIRKGNTPEYFPGPADTYASYGQTWANLSNTPFRYYKHFVHEGGIATPLIVRWPGHVKNMNGLTPYIGHVMDIMATCVDVAGAKYPKTFAGEKIAPFEGESLRPAWEGKSRERHAPIFWEHEGNCAVREGKWKLVLRREAGEWELYDMEADRTELSNLAAQKPAKVAELKKLHEAWAARVGVQPWDKVKELR